jgi:ATP-dependent RNA helicase RhlE
LRSIRDRESPCLEQHLPEPVGRISSPRPIHQELVITLSFDGLGLRAELLSAVAEQGYAQPTPIQSQAIPLVLSGRDVLGAAQTGTGKTAGFALPLLQRLAEGTATKLARALIITPTRELAAQVHEDVRTYGKHLSLRSAVIFGGVGMQPQIDALRRGVDIIVATPGRLLDHARQKTLDLRQIEILVLDEADRMLDMGFIPDVRRILALLPAKRQNLLFSATFPDEVRKLAATFMRDPRTIEVARRNTPAELVAQCAIPVKQDRKKDLLAHLVKDGDWRQVLVFCKTKRGANRLAQHLERDGVEADAIHGNKSQNARMRALKSFKDGELRVLVATDIAARGLDIEQLPHVVNFDLPHVPEDYVHRIGRTGRAGSSGEAITLVSNEERPLLAAIEKLMGRRIELREVTGYSSAESLHADHAPSHRRQPVSSGRPQRHSQPAPHRQTSQQPRRQHSQEPRRQHSQQPRRQDHQGKAQPSRESPAPVSGYRPMTAHAPTRRVPALLGKGRTSS